VVGRAEPVRIYEPLAPQGQETELQIMHAADYARALARWRSREFAACVKALSVSAVSDPPSWLLHERAQQLIANPPGSAWDGITALETK
jgi:adenylate cyclase